MASRKRFLISPCAWLALASLAACVDLPEEDKASQPPPVVGTKQKTNAERSGSAAGSRAQTDTSSGAGMRVMTAPAADGVSATPRDAAVADMDAGPANTGSGGDAAAAAAAVGGGSSGRPAAGSGGRSGAGGMRAAGGGGRSGAGGQVGAQSDACLNQLCFSVVDCWLLSSTDCSFSECDNFICR